VDEQQILQRNTGSVFAGFTLILFDGIKIETRRIKSGNRPVQSLYSFTDVQSSTDSCF